MLLMFILLYFADFFHALLVKPPKVMGLHVPQHLTDDKRATISSMGLKWVIQMLHIWMNHRFLIVLAERWHSENKIFHLPTREATITLEDVYHILWVPCYDDLVSFMFDFSFAF